MKPKTYWHHDETCCAREIVIGSRFQRECLDYATGITSTWKCTVVAVDPVDLTRIFCRRATVVGDDGRSCKPQIQELLSSRYQAIDNVIAFPGKAVDANRDADAVENSGGNRGADR